jgi:Colicin E5 ribonuclease domain
VIRRALTTVALALATVVLLPGVAVADNCSGLQDCYGSARSAAGAAAGMALIIGLVVLAAPALLRGARSESRPKADHKRSSGAPGDVANVEVPGVEGEPLRSDEKARRPGSADHKRSSGGPGDVANVEVPGVEGEPLHFDEKVRIDMAVRGWTPEVVAELAYHPAWTFATQDRRYNLDGSRAGQPATVFVRADSLYVVINNVTQDVVQVGAGPLNGMLAGPADPSWTESLYGRVAALGGGLDVCFAGPEPCYPVRGASVAIDLCLRNHVCVLGLEGLVLAEGRLFPRLDAILDCSEERNPGGAGTLEECAERAQTLIRNWSAIENCFVILTRNPTLFIQPSPLKKQR